MYTSIIYNLKKYIFFCLMFVQNYEVQIIDTSVQSGDFLCLSKCISIMDNKKCILFFCLMFLQKYEVQIIDTSIQSVSSLLLNFFVTVKIPTYALTHASLFYLLHTDIIFRIYQNQNNFLMLGFVYILYVIVIGVFFRHS